MASSARKTERMEFRATLELKTKTDRAAAAQGTTKAAFIADAVEKVAEEVLRREHEIVLTNARYDSFMAACQDESLLPSPRILEAARRLDQEGF